MCGGSGEEHDVTIVELRQKWPCPKELEWQGDVCGTQYFLDQEMFEITGEQRQLAERVRPISLLKSSGTEVLEPCTVHEGSEKHSCLGCMGSAPLCTPFRGRRPREGLLVDVHSALGSSFSGCGVTHGRGHINIIVTCHGCQSWIRPEEVALCGRCPATLYCRRWHINHHWPCADYGDGAHYSAGVGASRAAAVQGSRHSVRPALDSDGTGAACRRRGGNLPPMEP